MRTNTCKECKKQQTFNELWDTCDQCTHEEILKQTVHPQFVLDTFVWKLPDSWQWCCTCGQSSRPFGQKKFAETNMETHKAHFCPYRPSALRSV